MTYPLWYLKWVDFIFLSLGITLHFVAGRYATLLTIRSVLRTASLRSAQLRSADAIPQYK